MKLTGYNLLRAAAYYADVRFADIDEFLILIERKALKLSYDPSTVIRAFKQKARSTVQSGKLDEADVFRTLVARDLEKLLDSIESVPIKWNPKRELPIYAELCVNELSRLGLAITKPPINVVKRFPAPFANMPWEAFCPDATDERIHNIPQGMYFKEDQLQPLYTEYILSHEILHSLIGKTNPELLGRGLEEGICELLGALYLSLRARGEAFAKAIYSFSQLPYKHDPFWDLYTDYTRQAFLIYLEFGLDGLIEIINRGRAGVKEAERVLLLGKLTELKLSKGRWDSQFTELCSYLLMSKPRTLVVSPLAFYVAQFVDAGSTPLAISELSGVHLTLVKKALNELQEKVFVILSHDSKPIDSSDTRMLIETRTLRYMIPRRLHKYLLPR